MDNPQQACWESVLSEEIELEAAQIHLLLKRRGYRVRRTEKGTSWFFPGQWHIFDELGNVSSLNWDAQQLKWLILPDDDLKYPDVVELKNLIRQAREYGFYGFPKEASEPAAKPVDSPK